MLINLLISVGVSRWRGVFARLEPKLWVRRDGLSIDLLRSDDFQIAMWPHWACVVFLYRVFYSTRCFRYSVIKPAKQLGLENDSCPGRCRSRGRPSRGAGRCCRRAECSPAGTRTSTLNGGITAQLWEARLMPKQCKNRDSGGLVDRYPKGAEGKMRLKAKSKSFHTGAGLLALAAERNPQAFLGG